ncbi:MAG TPA: four helix bundle protein [Longimicrobiales bacterium]|nr:four helix bundle protein [Longimicrobiales bacterium]
MAHLAHERLSAYGSAIDLAVFLHHLTPELGSAGDLPGQLERAAVSIPLYVAAGASEPTSVEKRVFYRMARHSGLECLAILDVLEALGAVQASRLERGRLLLDEIVAMLGSMIVTKHRER